MHNNNKRKPASAASGSARPANPASVKKLVCIGPSMFGNYRVIAVLQNETEIHYYMDGRGNMYIPPKHTPRTLIDLNEAHKEWEWAKRTWKENNVPFSLFFKGNERLRNNAFKALKEVNESRLASEAVQVINAKTTQATLGDIAGLADIKANLNTASVEQKVELKKPVSPQIAKFNARYRKQPQTT